MSYHTYNIIDQLDLASEQMHRDQPTYARFALILVDNVVELIVHRSCSHEIYSDNLWLKLGKPKFTAQQREDASGQRFERKIAFLCSIGKISPSDSEFVRTCHKYRNEVYHSGVRWESILSDLALAYYDLAVTLFDTICPNNSWSSASSVSTSVLKHTGGEPHRVLGNVKSVCTSLRAGRPQFTRTLGVALSESAVQRVTDLNDALTFLVREDPSKRDEETILLELQLFDYLGSDKPEVVEVLKHAKTEPQRVAAYTYLRSIWLPKYARNPLGQFRSRALKMANANSPHAALRAFEQFKTNIEYFDRIVLAAASDLDDYIQYLIDKARGK